MQYLLSGNALLQLCTRDPTPIQTWARDKAAQNLRLSIIGVGMARETVARLDPVHRNRWSLALEHRINETQRESGRAIPVDERVVAKWIEVRSEHLEQLIENDEPEEIGQDARLEIAVALAYSMKLVDPWQPFHDQLRALGLGEHIESVQQ